MQKTEMTIQEMRTESWFLRAREITHLIQISRATLDRLVRDGDFPPPIKVGRVNRWRRTAIEEWAREREENAGRNNSQATCHACRQTADPSFHAEAAIQ